MSRTKYIAQVTRALLVLFLLPLGGCVVPFSYHVSVPQEIPSGHTGKIEKETITLDLADIRVSVQIQAYNWDGQYLLKPLGVWLEVDTKKGVVNLDPEKITLKSDDNEPLQAVSFMGPGDSWHSPRALAAGCGPRRFHTGIAITNIGVSQDQVIAATGEAIVLGKPPKQKIVKISKPSTGPVSFEGKQCFMFWFDTDPQPDHLFVLSLDGLAREDVSIRIPAISFKKGVVSTVRAVP